MGTGIKFVDVVARLGRVSTTLDGLAGQMQGTHVLPAGRIGTIGAQLAGVTSNINALNTPAPNRTGSLSTTFSGVTANVQGTSVAPTVPLNRDPVVTTPPTVTFIQGIAGTFDLSSYGTDPDGDPLIATKNAVALGSGVTFDGPNKRLVYDGAGGLSTSTGNVVFFDDGKSSVASVWNALSKGYQTNPAAARAQGITFATDFSNAAVDFDQTKHVFGANGVGGQTIAYWKSLVSRYTADPYFPTCLRIDSPAATGANGASWIFSLNETWTSKTQGFGGSDFWVYWRLKLPTSRMIQRVGGGFKIMDISAYDPQNPQSSISHTNFEHVTQNVNWKGIPTCYRDDGNGQPGFEFFDASVNDIRIQSVDNGAGVTPNSARYCLYNGSNYTSGCYPFFTNEWMHFKQRIRCANPGGTTGNQMDMFVARQGATQWTQIYNPRDYLLGLFSDGYTGGPCGGAINAYETGYDGSGSAATYQMWNWLVCGTVDPAPTPPAI